MHNSFIVRLACVAAVFGAGFMGFLAQEFSFMGLDFAAGLCVGSIVLFGYVVFDLLDN